MTEQSLPPTEPSADDGLRRRRRREPSRFQERLAELRIETIREAAGRVVARHGLAGATMDAIAEEAGVAKGTLYLYFKSREELIEKTADHALAALNRQVEAALAGAGGFSLQLAALVSAVLAFFDENAAF
ncbi:MAG TPA: helix-turn-helix domain-containing protein, partial [Thermoanaerobaculia bacterium]|nr:helix-turn-helix domain-containing protein [Thermoanaerobaculia bacterium]